MKKFIWRVRKLFWYIEEFLMNIRLWYLVKFNKKIFNNNPTPLTKEGYEITLIDEFNGNELNKNMWMDLTYFGLRFHPGNIIDKGIAPTTYYSEYNNVVSEGTLKQYTKKEEVGIHYIDWDGKDWGNYTIPFTSAMLTSKELKQQYGYFEIRAKMPRSTSTWPAFWLTGVNSWPPEIDIYEWYGSKSYGNFSSTFHWGVEKTESRRMSGWTHKLFDLTQDFHIYGCEWTPKHIKIYFDGVCVRTFKCKKALEWFNRPQDVMYVVINGGIEESKFDEATFPNIHEIDYVKAYKKI